MRSSAWLSVAVLAAAALVTFAIGVLRWDESEVTTRLGLLSALDGWFFAAAALLSMAFFVGVTRRVSASLLLLLVAAWAVMLHGLPALVESEPRFAVAYIHAGMAQHIASTGEPLPAIDARASWPGAFGLIALIGDLAGSVDLLWLVAWAPVVLNLLYCLPTWLIAEDIGLDAPRRWVALWLLLIFNWVGQDYLSPQGLVFVLHLLLIAVALRVFGRDHPPAAVDPPLGRRQRAWLVLGLVGAGGALVASHQLTPVVTVVMLAALAARRSIRLQWLWLVIATLMAVWLSVAAEPWWTGHLGAVLGNLGDIGGNVSSAVAQRVDVPSERGLVITARLAETVLCLALALAGVWRGCRAGARWDLLALFVAVPFLLVAAQSYGGEIVLRAMFYATPGVAIAATWALLGAAPGMPARHGWITAAVVVAVAVPGFVLSRYGNEAFERIPPQDRTAVEAFYDAAPAGAVVLAPSPNMPWQDRQLTGYMYESFLDLPLFTDSFDGVDDSELDELVRQLQDFEATAAYVLITDNAGRWASALHGAPEGWLSDWRRLLDGSPQFQRIFTDRDATLYVLRDVS